MNTYLDILQEKAKKIDVNIDMCGYDKECIKNALAAKVHSNLEDEDLITIREKAIEIKAETQGIDEDKNSLLEAIEKRVKEILEEENEKFTSMELQQSFMPIDLG
jgi:hypothetical protein